MDKYSFVYWIHLPEHTDILTQGYVGLTSKTVEERFRQHKKGAVSGNFHIHKAIRKYPDLMVKTLLCGSWEYCLLMESKLRPTSFVGWNMAVGGGCSNIGGKATEETRKKLSVAQKEVWQSAGYADKMSQAHLDSPYYEDAVKLLKEHSEQRWLNPDNKIKHSELMKQKSVELGLGKALIVYNENTAPWNRSFAVKAAWLTADKAYDLFKTSNLSPYSLGKSLQVSIKSARNLIKHFKAGWVPVEDSEWLAWKSN